MITVFDGHIAAAQHADISNVGYANKPGQRYRLSDAGANVVIDDMQALAHTAAISPGRQARR